MISTTDYIINKWAAEAYFGLQLCCCFNWNKWTRESLWNEKKLNTFAQAISFEVYSKHQDYILTLLHSIGKDFAANLEDFCRLIPPFAKKDVFQKCASIVAVTEQEADLKLLETIRERLGLGAHEASEIIEKTILDKRIQQQLLELKLK